MRVGHGFDVHRFGEGDHVMLGGVRIPFSHGFVAHSDGDVAIHALCDALLGAAGLGDIGRHFPDTSREFEDIDSRILLRRVVGQLQGQGYGIGNVDLTLVAQAPKLAPHFDTMRTNLAADLGVTVAQVNVKATTTEGLGFCGRGEGVAAHAVCLLVT